MRAATVRAGQFGGNLKRLYTLPLMRRCVGPPQVSGVLNKLVWHRVGPPLGIDETDRRSHLSLLNRIAAVVKKLIEWIVSRIDDSVVPVEANTFRDHDISDNKETTMRFAFQPWHLLGISFAGTAQQDYQKAIGYLLTEVQTYKGCWAKNGCR